jgi:hypothetical protein
MFERYTEKARRTIFFARYEASQYGSAQIETEHLLLGLLRESKVLANRFLSAHSSVESIRKQIEGHTTIREKVSTSVDLPLSDESKRVLAYAAEESERLAHNFIGTEHLMLGLLREESFFAAKLLNERSVFLESARASIASEVQGDLGRVPKSPGVPVGSGSRKLLYNPASETLIIEVRDFSAPYRLTARLFMRHKDQEAYERLATRRKVFPTNRRLPAKSIRSSSSAPPNATRQGGEIGPVCTPLISARRSCRFASRRNRLSFRSRTSGHGSWSWFRCRTMRRSYT